jgi:hypothetical protein
VPDATWVGDPLRPATPSADDVMPIAGGVRYIDPADGASTT